MSAEVELKLSISPNFVTENFKIEDLSVLKKAESKGQEQLLSIYYDTPDLALKAAQIALRTRRTPQGWVQTIKYGGHVIAGLHTRQEIEFPIVDESPRLTGLDALPHLTPENQKTLSYLTTILAQKTVIPVFTTEFTRTLYNIRTESGDLIEFAFDQGQIYTTNPTDPLSKNTGSSVEIISEIELELKQGKARTLYTLGLELLMCLPVRLGLLSKAARGYDLYHPIPLHPVKAKMPLLDPHENTEQAFIKMVRACLMHMQANEIGFVRHYQSDPEFLHQIRVALRRLRSIFNLFKNLLPKTIMRTITPELGWLNHKFGPARDWDVLNYETLPTLFATVHDHPELPALTQVLKTVHEEKLTAAHEAILSSHYSQLLLELNSWLDQCPWRLHADALVWDHPILEYAHHLLEKRHKVVVKRPKNLLKLDDTGRHELRIDCKKLRYSTEFFSSLYTQDHAKAATAQTFKTYLNALMALQDCLGHLNDSITAQETLAEVKHRVSPMQRALLECCLSQMTDKHDQLLTILGKDWSEFRECPRFWKSRKK